jgi:glucose-1-phosphate thymidylyltransferase
MNVIIPVAGEGTRLRPHTHTSPKSLIYVAGKTILDHILDGFSELKVKTFVIVHGAKGEAIIDNCQHRYEKFKFVFQEKRLGLGHAIYTGANGLRGPTIVLLGDTIIEYDFGKFKNLNTNILAVKAVDEPRRFGIVETKGTKVVDLVEKPSKPRSNLAITGLYYFLDIKKIYDAVGHIMREGIKTRGEYQITDALKYLLARGEPFNVTKIKKWFDCGTTAALLETNRHLLIKNHHVRKRKSLIIVPPVFIADSARIANSIIGPNVSIGEDVQISDSIIRDTIINSRADVRNALLAGSIVGEEACVKGGYKKLSVSDHSTIEFP